MSRQHIKDLRTFRKLSQAALGKAAGLTPAEISRIECGYRDMSEKEAVAIARALDVVPGKIDPKLLKSAAPAGLAAAAGPSAPAFPPAPGCLEDDPANFREMPDPGILEPTGMGASDHRLQLGEALKRAALILHTPKVPAATWRAWREFERKVQEKLRE